MRMIKNQTQVVPVDQVVRAETSRMREFILTVHLKDGSQMECSGLDAIESLLALKPSALEGIETIKWKKGAWIVHNLIAHPVMQILALLGFVKAGLWIHDVSVPGGTKIKYLKRKA